MHDDTPGGLTADNLKTLARLCRQYRHDRGLTLEAAAAKIGISSSAWHGVEREIAGSVGLSNLRKIVNLVGVLSPTPIKKDYHYGEDGRRKEQGRGTSHGQGQESAKGQAAAGR